MTVTGTHETKSNLHERIVECAWFVPVDTGNGWDLRYEVFPLVNLDVIPEEL